MCGLMLTLLLGFGKRRAETAVAGATRTRGARRYSPALLDRLIVVCVSGTLIAYSLYTISPQTIALHGSADLVYTVPIVTYALFRYLYLLGNGHAAEDPSGLFVGDRHLQAAALRGWSRLSGFCASRIAAVRTLPSAADEVKADIRLAARNQVGDRLARARGHRPPERAVTGIQIEVRIARPADQRHVRPRRRRKPVQYSARVASIAPPNPSPARRVSAWQRTTLRSRL